jgi:hypothetical protein
MGQFQIDIDAVKKRIGHDNQRHLNLARQDLEVGYEGPASEKLAERTIFGSVPEGGRSWRIQSSTSRAKHERRL